MIRPYSPEPAGSAPYSVSTAFFSSGSRAAAVLRVGQDVVGGDAGLSGVEELAAGQAVGDDGEVGVAVDERRGLAAQFQGDRGEVLGGGAQDDSADRAVAGVEDVVEAFGQQGGGLRDAALDDGDGVRVQVGGEQPGDGGGGGRGQLAGLGDHRVAGGEGADHRGEQQLGRVVPGGDDEDDTERVVLGPGPRVGTEVSRDGGGLGAQPVGEVVQGVVDLPDREVDLGAEGLGGALAQVGVEGGGQVRAVLREHLAQAAQLGRAPLDGLGAAAAEGGPQSGDDVGGLLGGGVVHGCLAGVRGPFGLGLNIQMHIATFFRPGKFRVATGIFRAGVTALGGAVRGTRAPPGSW
ncbi:hypothetical protein M2162_007466 [Streptomyces sp. SAI-041]|nr:hypothetical protein [Streptomyces sp. SAI-041]